MSSVKLPVRKLAVFNSRPINDYDTLATALMSIVSNKFLESELTIIKHAEDESTKKLVGEVVDQYNLNSVDCRNRNEVIGSMTDAILFCAADDPKLFMELSPLRDKGVTIYFVVQE